MTPEERSLSALLHSSTPEPPMTITGAEVIERARRSRDGRIRRWAPVAATAAVAAGIIAAVAAVSIVPTQRAQPPATQPTSRIDQPVVPEATPSGVSSDRVVGQSSPDRRAPGATPSGQVSVGPPPAADRRPSPTPTAPRCASTDLVANVDAGPAANAVVVVVRNQADGACAISGYPDFPVLDKLQAPPRQALPPDPTSAPDGTAIGHEPPELILAPSDTASFVVDQSWRWMTFDNAAAAPAQGADAPGGGTVTAEAFTIPGDPTPISLPTAIVLRSSGAGGLDAQISPFGADGRSSATPTTTGP